jgi:hypothetical protein
MFDPLFTLSFLALVTIPPGLAVFLIARCFLPATSARLMAFVLPLAALAGFFGTALTQARFNPDFFDEPPLARIAVSFIGGVLLAGLMGWAIWRSTRLDRPI